MGRARIVDPSADPLSTTTSSSSTSWTLGPDPRAGEIGILCPSDTAPPMPLGLGDLLSRAACLTSCVGAGQGGEELGSRWVRRGGESRGRGGCNLGPRCPHWASRGPQPGMGPIPRGAKWTGHFQCLVALISACPALPDLPGP